MNARLEPPEDFIDVNVEDKTKIQSDIEDELNEILSEIDADDDDISYKVSVSRDGEGNKVGPHLFDCSIGEVDGLKDRLRNNYGSGKYQIRVYKNKKLYRRKILWLEAPKEPETNPQNSQIADLSAMMQRQNEQMMNLMQKRSPTEQTDPTAMMASVLTSMEKMMSLFMPKQTAQKDPIDMLLKGMELAQGFEKGGDGNKNVFDAITSLANSELGKAAVEQLQKNQAGENSYPQNPYMQRPQAIRQNPEAPINPEPVSPPHPHTNPNTEQKPLPRGLIGIPVEILHQINEQINFWDFKAKNNSAPELWAEVAVDTYEPEVVKMILDRPDLKEIVLYFCPAAEQNFDWFEALKKEAMAILTEDDNITDNGNEQKNPQSTVVNVSERTATPTARNPDGDPFGPGRNGGDSGNHAPFGEGIES